MNLFATVFCFLVIGLAPAAQASTPAEETPEPITLIGTHLSEDYIFVLHPVWQDIQGSWGRLNYDIRWDSDFKIVEGTAAHNDIFVEFSKDLGQIFGETSTCGWIDLFFASRSPWVLEGRLCDEMIRQEFETENSMRAWPEQQVAQSIASEFPEPAQLQVQNFLSELMDFHIEPEEN